MIVGAYASICEKAGEARITFGDIDSADFACPIVDVAEQPLVDGLKVRQVETALHWLRRHLVRPQRGKRRLGPIKHLRIDYAKLVPQDACGGIQIRIGGVDGVFDHRRLRLRDERKKPA
ncbi:hypothetical protein [Bordetella genomosp. 5]|uniref:hypothetical protein n=1 Tax=Bordetella genomosp. 5 TaxID=1395608 RepID=UPI001BAF90C3|nr:hypothetical protein [Bordetella genomosp. 5]